MERLADRYELGSALGHGRSTVYRAVDTRLRREVAIKRVALLAGQEDVDQVRTRALREAQASARLNNPAAVALYDVVEESGAVWLVMELVDGPSLAQIVADGGPVPHRRAAAIGLAVLTALEAAHLVGVIHRDVKPANVLVPSGDRAKLTDFGVATLRDESRVTATGLIVGSPSYMAPEQATGGDITAATDLWALGALLYFAVEGEPPFQAGSALATATAVVHAPPRPQQRSGPLDRIVGRLLVKEPAGRASAGEVRAALARVAREAAAAAAAGPSDPLASVAASAAASVGPALTPAPPDEPRPAEPVGSAVVPLVAASRVASGDRTTMQARRSAAPQEPTPRPPVALLALGALMLVVAAAIIVPVLTSDPGDDPRDRAATATTDPASGTDGGATGNAGGGSPTTTEAGDEPPSAGEAVALPAGWAPYRDPQGAYTIGMPPGWRVEPTGSANRVDLVDPDSGSFLRIEWTSSPGADPAQAWRDLASGFAARNTNYRELGIGPTSYRDYDAALWEFTHGGGQTLHTGNLGFVAAGRGYALMLRTPEALWDASQPLFDQFQQAFQPA